MNSNNNKLIIFIVFLLLCNNIIKGRENINEPGKKTNLSSKILAADCTPARSSFDMDVNNVRARLLNGGDMWWDLSNSAQYEVPKGGGVSSLFAGAIWIGGYDEGNNLKIAGQTYRQTGNDFFPGPLDANASIDKATCDDWDNHFSVLLADIDALKEDYESDSVVNNGIPKSILNWPASGNTNSSIVLDFEGINGKRELAPFFDRGGDGDYDPYDGDYPVLDPKYPSVVPDQMVWWIYNDKGNTHSETGGEAIGMEIHATAFAYTTNNEINDMTFYQYKLINRSSNTLDSTYIAKWVDADLGYAYDDYVGCDTSREFGICYNGDAEDGPSVISYGTNPPLVGIDFFEGPIDVDSTELGMSVFLYYNNDFSVRGNPESSSDFYGYMTGTWKDGMPFTFGGTGYGGTQNFPYMFPGDPSNSGEWSECSENNVPADRRFLLSSGPFTLAPGASNQVTIGAVWVQPANTGKCAPFTALLIADDKAQALFDNNFEILDGPDAPNMSIRELENELIFSLWYSKSHNNYNESYKGVDPIIKAIGVSDSFYRFQGYIIYQLKDATVSNIELSDLDKARIVVQVDIKDSVDKLVNYYYDEILEANVPVLEVDGDNKGIQHTFSIKKDMFATGSSILVNNWSYYYTVIAYAFNEYLSYGPDTAGKVVGQSMPFLAGRKNIQTYTAIPHLTAPENFGTKLNAKYGDAPQIKRIEGQGNGGLFLDLTQASIDEILTSPDYRSLNPVYKAGYGPVNIKVYDPMKVPAANFKLYIQGDSTQHILIGHPLITGNDTSYFLADSSTWYMVNLTDGDTVFSDKTMRFANEQLIAQWGLSVNITQTMAPGWVDPFTNKLLEGNGFIDATMEFDDSLNRWLSGVADMDINNFYSLNWIRSGTFTDDDDASHNDYHFGSLPASPIPDSIWYDPLETFENILSLSSSGGGTWAPYLLTNCNIKDMMIIEMLSPAWYDVTFWGTISRKWLFKLQSVDIVLTSDKSKWTKCVVIETQSETVLSEGGAKKMEKRKHNSWNKDGTYDSGSQGLSWFPGYAVNLETGERLNIMFGENSWMVAENGSDMIWNPTSTYYTPVNEIKYGGEHFIYILDSKYDGTAQAIDSMLTLSETDAWEKRKFYNGILWVGVPILQPSSNLLSVSAGLIPTKTTIKLRVNKPYAPYTIAGENSSMPVYEFSTMTLATTTNDIDIAKSALDTIKVVPNPYYSFSAYENSQLDTRVKFTNLPKKCTISIYKMNGTLVRKLERDDNSVTFLDWDLKNINGIPVSSGVYLIHIKADGLGEKVLKWFGVMRPADLDTF